MSDAARFSTEFFLRSAVQSFDKVRCHDINATTKTHHHKNHFKQFPDSTTFSANLQKSFCQQITVQKVN